MGRPPKFDDIRAKRAIDAVRQGLSRTAVAAKAGVSRTLLLDWLARGRDGEEPFADFLTRFKLAEAEAESEMVACVRTAGLDPKHWQAAAWWLERTRPADYAKREPTHEQETARAEHDTPDLEVAKSVVAALESRKGAA